MTTVRTKRKRSFKDIMKMFDEDRMPLNYLWHNISNAERTTFRNGIYKNIKKHFPDGRVLSERQLKVLEKDIFIIQCKNEDCIEYHYNWNRENLSLCNACFSHSQRNKIMKCSVAKDNLTECCICISNIEKNSQIAELKCSHQFHTDCIKRWFRQSINCPCCRSGFLTAT
jgi:Ring finger domain